MALPRLCGENVVVTMVDPSLNTLVPQNNIVVATCVYHKMFNFLTLALVVANLANTE